MWDATYWKMLCERVFVGAVGGIGTGTALTGLDIYSSATWKAMLAGAVVGGLTAFTASVLGGATGNRRIPLATAPKETTDE